MFVNGRGVWFAVLILLFSVWYVFECMVMICVCCLFGCVVWLDEFWFLYM